MTDRPTAASPWEVEAERRREVIASEVAAAREAARTEPDRDLLLVASGRRVLRSLTTGSREATGRDVKPPQAGRLNQKRV